MSSGHGWRTREMTRLTLLDRLLRVVGAVQHGHVQLTRLSCCDAQPEHTSDPEPAAKRAVVEQRER